jgi:hypothetical protein
MNTTVQKTDSGERPSGTWKAVALLLALIAALAAWATGESGSLRFTPATAQVNIMGTIGRSTTAETRQLALVRSAALAHGVFGALLGLVLGLTGGLAGHRPRGLILPALAGLFFGGGAGALSALVVLPLYFRWIGESAGEILPSLLTHCALWVGFGITAGLAWGLGTADRPGVVRAALAGALGVILGAVLFELLGAVALPTSGTSDPIPGTATARLVADALVAVSAAAGAAFAGAGRPQV